MPFFLLLFPDNFFLGELPLMFCVRFLLLFFFPPPLLHNYNLVLRCVMTVHKILKYC